MIYVLDNRLLPIGQKGFLDEQERVSKLKNKNPVLTCLSESIPWEAFRPLLDKGYIQERKSNVAAKELIRLFYLKCWFSNNFLTLVMKRLNFMLMTGVRSVEAGIGGSFLRLFF